MYVHTFVFFSIHEQCDTLHTVKALSPVLPVASEKMRLETWSAEDVGGGRAGKMMPSYTNLSI